MTEDADPIASLAGFDRHMDAVEELVGASIRSYQREWIKHYHDRLEEQLWKALEEGSDFVHIQFGGGKSLASASLAESLSYEIRRTDNPEPPWPGASERYDLRYYTLEGVESMVGERP